MFGKKKARRSAGQAQAENALAQAVEQLHGVARTDPEIRSLASMMRGIQKKNGFAPAIRETYQRTSHG